MRFWDINPSSSLTLWAKICPGVEGFSMNKARQPWKSHSIIMEECKTQMRAGGWSQQRPATLKQRTSKGMFTRKHNSFPLRLHLREWLGTGLETWDCAGAASSCLELCPSHLLPSVTETKLPRLSNKEDLFLWILNSAWKAIKLALMFYSNIRNGREKHPGAPWI